MAKAPRSPSAASVVYQLRLRKAAAQWIQRARVVLAPIATALSELERGQEAPSFKGAIDALKREATAIGEAPALGHAIAAVGLQVERHTAGELSRLAIKPNPAKPRLDASDRKPWHRARGVRLDDAGGKVERPKLGIKLEPAIRKQLDGWRAKNVDLITGALHQQADKIGEVLAASHGSRHEVIAKRLEERFGITTRRAELIARDQVLTLNAQINAAKMQAAGINKYIWTTTGDERVRGDPDGQYPDSDEDHFALDGQECSFDDPPVVNPKTGETANPGEPVNCRCTPYPVLDELTDDEPADPEPTETPPPEPEPAAQPEPAEPERPTLREGEHVKRLDLQGEDAKEAFDRLQHVLTAEDLAYLKATPIEQLTITGQVEYLGGTPNGLYHPGLHRMALSLDRQPGSYGKEFEPSVWSVSSVGKTVEEAQERTFTHEFGHHVHLSSGGRADDIVQEAFKVGEGSCITQYGRGSAEEYFAECFAMARFHPEELERYDNNGWKMVQDVLALHQKSGPVSILDL